MTSSRRDSSGTCQVVIGLSKKADAMASATLGKSASVAVLTSTAAPTARVHISISDPFCDPTVGSLLTGGVRKGRTLVHSDRTPSSPGKNAQLDQVTGTRG